MKMQSTGEMLITELNTTRDGAYGRRVGTNGAARGEELWLGKNWAKVQL